MKLINEKINKVVNDFLEDGQRQCLGYELRGHVADRIEVIASRIQNYVAQKMDYP